MQPVIRIATRESPLALWQARHVAQELQKLYDGLRVELIGMTTQGDRVLESTLASVGGKGLFVKELEQALLDRRADIAVHSMKDVTVDFPEGLALSVIMQRADPRDVFISNAFAALAELPEGSCVGTSSLRRQCQLYAHRPDLEIIPLRGNVGTRLHKLDEGMYDAIILASAGVTRLGLADRVREYLSPDVMLPAAGQGAIGIETRTHDREMIDMLLPLNHTSTRIQLAAERALTRNLYGGCQLPIAAYAEISGEAIKLRGLVGSHDGRTIISDSVLGHINEAEMLGTALAQRLLNKGADKILQNVRHG